MSGSSYRQDEMIDFGGTSLYHPAAMSTGLPRQIQVMRGQGGERHYSGRLTLDELPRIKSCVFGEQASIEVDLTLNRDRRGCKARPNIRLRLQLQCQRCMDVMDWEAELSNELQLVNDDVDAWAEDQQDETFILQDGVLDVPVLVEDEIILALPIAPLHENDSECGKQVLNKSVTDEEVSNPFAVLAALKPKH